MSALKSGEKLSADARHRRKNARRGAIEERIKEKAEEWTSILDEITNELSQKDELPDTSANPSARTISSILACYEQRYIRSERNPVHVWAAIALCTDPGCGQTPLPPWCADYLQSVAKAVVSIDIRIATGRSDPAEPGLYERAVNEATRALGFTSGRGRNAFKRAASDRKKIAVALAVDELRLTGDTLDEAYQGAAVKCGIADRDAGTDPEYAKKLSAAGKSQLRRSPTDEGK